MINLYTVEAQTLFIWTRERLMFTEGSVHINPQSNVISVFLSMVMACFTTVC